MNKNKQVSHSKKETMSVIFTHPVPNPSAPQNIVWLIWPNPEIPKIIVVTSQNKQYIYQLWFLKKNKANLI